MKVIFITYLLTTFFYCETCNSQKLNDYYYHCQDIKEPDGNYGILEIHINSDSTYIQTAYMGDKNNLKDWRSKWVKIVKSGRIKKEKEFYRFIENKKPENDGLHVKILKKELHVYVGRFEKGEMKLVKGLIYLRDRINGKKVRNKRKFK